VIADEGGDPFIFSRASHAVLHAYHGEGVWKPVALFGDLTEMATTLAIIGDIVETAGRLLTDDDSIVLPRYQNEARARFSAWLNSSEKADDVLQRLGWIDF
jgi:hypothetical protein